MKIQIRKKVKILSDIIQTII
uniref:Uncharacterized protein n=1 Tax=Heterorhabditis bacteriophora TaxID=37862 RepID=A0A1I7WKF3_HETBA